MTEHDASDPDDATGNDAPPDREEPPGGTGEGRRPADPGGVDGGATRGTGPPEPGSPEERFEDRVRISVPARHNPKLAAMVDRVNEDDELYAQWVAANVNAVDRLNMSDHGPVHMQIVANSALKLLRLLVDAGIPSSSMRDYGLEAEDAEIVVVAAALFHDVGMSIHRENHEAYSLFVAQPKLRDLLGEIYDPPRDSIMRSEILHAIIAHRSGGTPLTVEAGVLRIADALDMAEGRSRIPFERGSTSIHSVSAAAIESVHIEEGETTPVRVRVEMTNSAGVFQVDQLLRKKLSGSGLERFMQVEAHIEAEEEKQLVERFQL